jgi:hypothetical protein
VTRQDPDIAALSARLGLHGMHYRTFGNRPVPAIPAAAEAPPADPTPAVTAPRLDLVPPAAMAMPQAALTAMPSTAMTPMSQAAMAPMPPAMTFPLIAAALGAAAAPAAPAPTEATLAFVGLRARLAPAR